MLLMLRGHLLTVTSPKMGPSAVTKQSHTATRRLFSTLASWSLHHVTKAKTFSESGVGEKNDV